MNRKIKAINPEIRPIKMRHVRQIKPGLFESESIAELSITARYFFIGLLTCADMEGRFEWKPRTLKNQIMPFDHEDAAAILEELSTHDRVVKYTVDGREYGYIVDFRQHQVINVHEKNAGPQYPAPSAHGASTGQSMDGASTVQAHA